MKSLKTNKKFGVIDIGSNSVRLMMNVDGKTIYKCLNTTRLGEGVSIDNKLKSNRIELSVLAIKEFKKKALNEGAVKVYAFATAAVRSSENGNDFVKRVKEVAALDVDVISGEEEARIGILGALKGKDGGIIDVGGASTEITVQINGKKVYSKSLDIGTVRLLDLCGQDKDKLNLYINEKIKEYGNIPKAEMYAIGGTATTLAAIDLGLKIYDPVKINGHSIQLRNLKEIKDKLLKLTPEFRKKIDGVEPTRAEVIGGGSLLMYKIIKKLGLTHINVSEDDNLEGYLMSKEGL
jgi:exopolyphosphatase/guanosine-5'-triphosphate,3'-diphosphate pyrophosphatase